MGRDPYPLQKQKATDANTLHFLHLSDVLFYLHF